MIIATVIGARPQFIKAAMVSRAFTEHNQKHPPQQIQERVVHTGQHFNTSMSKIFFDELEIARPDYHLGIGGGSHGQNTGRMLEKIESVLQEIKPDCVLVYGDTDSTLAGALAAAKLHISVAHVEAGLRSFNRSMPEEINRILTDHTADILLTPTDIATSNLAFEGIGGNRVHQVGDVMYDAALYYAAIARQKSNILPRLGLSPGDFILATIHRAENTDDPVVLSTIMSELAELTKSLKVVLPLHPRTVMRLTEFGINVSKKILISDPIGYFDMVMLEKNAAVIVTDSGGVQKEAFFHGVPCVTLRGETEWLELLDRKWNRLSPPLESEIATTILSAIGTSGYPGTPYGNGDAARKIVNILAGSI